MAILFAKDWDKYPHAIRHYTTKNRSWVRQALLYKKIMGIENYDFILALHNPELEHVDPHSEDLTDRQKLAIMNECSENPWYFYREVARVPAKAGVGSNPVKCGRMLIAALWLFYNHIDAALCSHRQSGKTFTIYLLKAHLLTAMCFNSVILWGTINERKRVETIRSMKELLNLLPDYIYKPIKNLDADNQSTLTNVLRKNYVEYVVGQADPIRANEAGRGFSIAIKFYDEVAETKNAHIMIAAAANSSNAVVREAKEKNAPWGTSYMCTAGDIQRAEGRFYYELANDGMFWSETLFDSEDEDDLRTTVGMASADPDAPLVNCTFSWRQNGLSEDEFKQIVARARQAAKGDEDKVRRECYSIWSMGGRANALTPDQAEVVHNSQVEPTRIEKHPTKMLINWYEDFRKLEQLDAEHRLVIGLDTSQGVNRDACSLTLTDIGTLETLARSDVSQVNLRIYGKFIIQMLRMFPNSVLVIENKASGQGIIDAIIVDMCAAGIDPFKRMFNRIWQEPEKYASQYHELRSTPVHRRTVEWYDQFKGLIGFSTNSRLRQELYDQALTEAIQLGGSKIKDRTLAQQLMALEIRNGRVDHAVGGHDDACISYLLVAWFAVNGKNFKHYGIDSRTPLRHTVRTETGMCTEEDLQRQRDLLFFENLANDLKAKIRENGDSYYGLSLQRQLENVDRELEKLGGMSNNLEQVLEEIRDEARRRRKQKNIYRR